MKKITTIVLVALGVTLISANFISKSEPKAVAPAQEVAVTAQSSDQGSGIIETNDKSWN